MSHLLRLYVRAINTHPWKTQCLSTGVLMCLGDGLAQVFVEKKSFDKFDLKRSGRFFLYGTVIVGPTLRTWYIVLDKVVRGPGKITALKKVALDQIAFAPAFIAFFLTSMTFFSTGSTAASIEKCKQDWKEVVITNWKIWPAAQILNFYLIPLNWRLIYVNVIAVFWNTYLAYVSERSTKTDS